MKYNKFYFGAFVTFLAFCLFFFFFFGFGTTRAQSTKQMMSKKAVAYNYDKGSDTKDQKEIDKAADYTIEAAKHNGDYQEHQYVAMYKARQSSKAGLKDNEQKLSKVELKDNDKLQYMEVKTKYGETKLAAKYDDKETKDGVYYATDKVKDYDATKNEDAKVTYKPMDKDLYIAYKADTKIADKPTV